MLPFLMSIFTFMFGGFGVFFGLGNLFYVLRKSLEAASSPNNLMGLIDPLSLIAMCVFTITCLYAAKYCAMTVTALKMAEARERYAKKV